MEFVHVPGCSEQHRPRQRCDGAVAELQRAAMQPPVEVPARQTYGRSADARALLPWIAVAILTAQVLWTAACWNYAVASPYDDFGSTNTWRLYLVFLGPWLYGEAVLTPLTSVAVCSVVVPLFVGRAHVIRLDRTHQWPRRLKIAGAILGIVTAVEALLVFGAPVALLADGGEDGLVAAGLLGLVAVLSSPIVTLSSVAYVGMAAWTVWRRPAIE